MYSFWWIKDVWNKLSAIAIDNIIDAVLDQEGLLQDVKDGKGKM